MIEADPLSMVLIANDAAQSIAQAGPPSDLPAPVPDFVSDILDTVRNAAGEGSLGERISELTPGGNETAGEAGNAAAGAGAENASS